MGEAMGNVGVESTRVRQITIGCARNEGEFRQLEPYWNALVMGSNRPSPFLMYDWSSAWWRHIAKGEELFVLVASDGDEIVGIAPLCIRTDRLFGLDVRTVEFLGARHVSPDYMDFITIPERRTEIVSALALALVSRRDEWDVVSFKDVAQVSIAPDALVEALAPHHIPVFKSVDARCPYMEVPESWAALLRNYSAKRRSFLRKKRARLESEFHTQFVTVESPADVPAHIRVLAQLHSSSMVRRHQRSPLEDECVRPFQNEVALRMAENNCFYGARLECNGIPVSANFGFRLKDHFFYYQTGFATRLSQYSVGTVLLALTIQDLLERLRIAEFDFLEGPEQYKYDWTEQERKTWCVRCFNRTTAGTLMLHSYTASSWLSAQKRRMQEQASSLVRDFHRRMSCLVS